jgi:cytochrome P450
MHLARAEAQIALERLFNRFPDLERAPKNAPPVYSERYGFRGMKTLKVNLKP